MSHPDRVRTAPLPAGYQFGDARRVILTALRVERAKLDDRVDGRADRPSLSGGDREPDDFGIGSGVPSWTVEGNRLVRLPPLPNIHKKYREYREWDAKQGPISQSEGYDWDPPATLTRTYDHNFTANVIEGDTFASDAERHPVTLGFDTDRDRGDEA